MLIEEKDYPALYIAANTASKRNQNYHIGLIIAYLTSLILGAIFAFYGINSALFAIIAAFFFVMGFLFTIFILIKNHENAWYNCRALAESIKTSTWKYMMRAEPYEDSENINFTNSEFRNMLLQLLTQNSGLAHEFGGNVSEQEQITEKMKHVRKVELNGRKDIYTINRIDDQRKWYSKKFIQNNDQKKLWFSILLILNILALILVLSRIYFPTFQYWPVEVLVVLAGSCLTWIQLKKFQELTSAYSMAAHEIGIIRGEIETVNSEDNFSDFVNDAENAFSREHTRWLAKRTY
ncbi:MAG: DUF4231 domain-containing protein [Balneolales bacterium]